MTDDELLAALAEALEPTVVVPSGDSVHALRYLVARQAIAGGSRAPRPRFWRRAGWLIPATAAATLIAGTSGAYAMTGAELPRPLRSVAAAVGLTDPPAVADARHAAHVLTKDLEAPPGSATAAVVAKDVQNLSHRLDQLNSTQRGKAVPQAQALLQRADQVVHQPEAVAGDDHHGAGTIQPVAGVQPAHDTTTSSSARTGGSDEQSATSGPKGEPGSGAGGSKDSGHIEAAPKPTTKPTTTRPTGGDQGSGEGGSSPHSSTSSPPVSPPSSSGRSGSSGNSGG